VTNKCIKKCSTSSYKGNANQNYTEIPFCSNQNGNQENKQHMLAKMQGKRNPHYCWECKLGHPLWKPVWRCIKTKNRPTWWVCYTTLGYISKYKSPYKHVHLFIAALFKRAKLWNQPRCPKTDQCTKKMWYVYIYIYIYIYTHTHTHIQWNTSAIKNEIMSFAGKWVHEISQAQKSEILHGLLTWGP
jgi:hypothetical protein